MIQHALSQHLWFYAVAALFDEAAGVEAQYAHCHNICAVAALLDEAAGAAARHADAADEAEEAREDHEASDHDCDDDGDLDPFLLCRRQRIRQAVVDLLGDLRHQVLTSASSHAQQSEIDFYL